MFPELQEKGERARHASRKLMTLKTDAKNAALRAIADALLDGERDILSANVRDMDAGRQVGMSDAMLDRLLIDARRLKGIAGDVLTVAGLPDPAGEVIEDEVPDAGALFGEVLPAPGVLHENLWRLRPEV